MRYLLRRGHLAVLIGLVVLAAPSSRLASPRTRLTRAATLNMLTLNSRALGEKTGVAVLLPDGYASTTRRYPVLYLLAGHEGTHWQWLTNGDTIPLFKHLPMIVVMPDGLKGWYVNPASGNGPRWEDYDIHELIPYIDSHYRTVANRTGRAVAGLSMGGYGAFEYAARHPDLFVAAASFSGNLDLLSLQTPYWFKTYPTLTLFGNTRTDALYWHGHNPIDLAPNLHGIRLYLASGNGQPGPLDGSRRSADEWEVNTHGALLAMSAALARAGVPATVEYYGAGTHTWPYFKRDLHHALPLMMDAFAHPPAPAAPWSYRTVDDRFEVWGYHGARTGAPPAWTALTNVSRGGLTATGSGLLTITTAPLYRRGTVYHLAGATPALARADGSGRLQLQIRLAGPGTPQQVTIAA